MSTELSATSSSSSHLTLNSSSPIPIIPSSSRPLCTPPFGPARNALSARDDCHINTLVIELSTSVTIDHFRRYYHEPIDTFIPTYTALADGSLVNPPLVEDIRTVAIDAAITSALIVFFLSNTLTAGKYLYRGLVKNKILFYFLLCSQLFGLVAMTAVFVPFFYTHSNCQVVAVVTRILSMLSYTMLITGILGFKAYRCLNNSRIVALVLLGVRTAILVFLGLDSSRLKSFRRLTIGCGMLQETAFLPIMVALMFAESLFICGCFFTAAWKASRMPADHGRLSIEPTLDLKPYSNRVSGVPQEQQSRRGWWDYEPPLPPAPAPIKDVSMRPRLFRAIFGSVEARSFAPTKLRKRDAKDKPSVESLAPPQLTVNGLPSNIRSRRSSVVSRISKYMPRMTLLKRMLNDELLHTALMSTLLLVTAVLMLVGTTRKLVLDPSAWVSINWIVTAMLTMHSFDRVVRRHEQEAILQQPATWDPIYRAELEASRALRQDRARRANSTIPPTPTPRRLNWSDEPSVRIRSMTPSVAMPRGRLSPYTRFHSEAHSARVSRTVSIVPTEKSSTTQKDHIVPVGQHSLPSQSRSSSQDAVSPSPSESDFSTSPPSPCASDLHILRRSSSALSDTGMDAQN